MQMWTSTVIRPAPPYGSRTRRRIRLRRTRRSLALTLSSLLAASLGVFFAPSAFPVTPHPERPIDKSNLQELSVESVEVTDDGATFDLGYFTGSIRLLSEDIAKVSLRAEGKEEYVSPGIAKLDWTPPAFTTSDTPETFTLRTAKLTVEVSKAKWGVRMLDAAGKVINEDDLDYGSGYEDGKPYVFKKTDRDEAFYGFGEQSKDLNKRGDSVRLWNTDNYAYSPTEPYLYASIPFFYGLKGDGTAYGIFFDNTHRSYYEMASESEDYYSFHADGGDLTYYFFEGPEIPDILKNYTELTGRTPQPANWALGWQQSKWGYYPDTKITEVAKGYRDRGIPLDTMNLDIDYMDEFRVFTWGQGFDDPEALDAELEAMGVSTVTINDPAVKVDPGNPDYPLYDEANAAGLFATNPDGSDHVGAVWSGPSKFPDFTLPETRKWWADQHGTLLDRGVDGIWLDMNEPADFVNEYHTPPIDVEFDHGQKTHEEVHNIYGMLETEATRQGFEEFKPGVRPFILTRDMYAGSQRWGALWTGDNIANWDHLALTLPMNMNVGMSGISHVGNDIGGFAETDRPRTSNAELLARWMQVGAFTPHARVHYGKDNNPVQCQEPWCFGPETEAIGKKYIELRYKLLPYLYNAFHQSYLDGRPVEQPLVFQYQDDPKVRDIQDQYMWGSDLMIAPVVKEGQRARNVYLPAGSRWTDYWTGSTFNGGQTISRQTPLSVMPIYIRSDSVIPTREVQQYTDQAPLTNLVLDTVVDTTASTTFYEDDGATLDYQQGEYDETKFTASRGPNGTIVFDQEVVTDGFASALTSVTWQVRDVPRPRAVEGVAASAGARSASPIAYDETTRTATVTVPIGTSGPVTLTF